MAQDLRINRTDTINLSLKPTFYGTIKTGLGYYSYKEPNVMSITGPMYVVSAIGGLKLNPLIKTDATLYYSRDLGRNTYDGGIMLNDGSILPHQSLSSDWYVGGKYRAGLIIGNGIDEWLVLYLGLGYRYLHNQIHGSGAYLREQTYLYMPMGGQVKVWLFDKVRLNLDVEFRALLLGNNISHFKDLGYDNNLHFIQNSGSGTRVTLGAEVFITRKSSILVEGFLDYWNIGQSSKEKLYEKGISKGSYIEPVNKTLFYGLQVGYSF
ncbi:hypothetical protein [Helicobacter sp. 11S03491-1]|uniref:hypothetical protein n=1 Tax=Helicobacter sp. 11S03491-1 TaxID=1476196 RepID=UPI00117A77F8|nr:hypothetical protein [Helicobacter sp. 11S03491-1]